jgi:hypothetical protein
MWSVSNGEMEWSNGAGVVDVMTLARKRGSRTFV